MEIERHEDVEKDLIKLRRYRAPLEFLQAWERLFVLKGLKETPAIDIFSGFGLLKIYKGRVVPLKENLGKSKGYRVIFKMVEDSHCKIIVFSRHGIYKSEQELISLIKKRLGL